jgi:hypothetical protein
LNKVVCYLLPPAPGVVAALCLVPGSRLPKQGARGGRAQGRGWAWGTASATRTALVGAFFRGKGPPGPGGGKPPLPTAGHPPKGLWLRLRLRAGAPPPGEPMNAMSTAISSSHPVELRAACVLVLERQLGHAPGNHRVRIRTVHQV